MSLLEMINNSYGNISINVTLSDLREFAMLLIEQTKRETAAVEKKKSLNAYCTRKEVESLLSISTATLYNWKNKKYLVPHKIGNRVLWLRSDVENLINAKNND